MNNIKRIVLSFLLCTIQIVLFAQTMDNSTAAPTDFMRSEGKLYVVLAVVVTIVLGILIYLINLDRKISKLEKAIK